MQQKIAAARAWLTKHENAVFWPLFALLALALAFLCFYKLGGYMLNPWDEARHGVNGYEMLQNHDYIVTTYAYEPDYFNMKPPLSMWAAALGFRLFGYSAFGLRFFSALSMLLTGVLCGLFARRRAGSLAGLATLGMFLVCEPFFNYHMARSGDPDAIYCLFYTIAMLAMLQLDRKPRLLYLCGLAFGFAFLAKSWHAGVLVLVGAAFLLLTGLIRQYRPGQLALFAGCALLPEGLWAAWRYTQDGWLFLGQMFSTDVTDRLSGNTNADLSASPLDYLFDYAKYPEFFGYLLLAAAGAALVLLARKKGTLRPGQGRCAFGLALWVLVPFVLFSLAGGKKIWYLFPAVIGLLAAAGFGVQALADTGFSGSEKSLSLKKAAAVLAVVLLAALPLETGFKETLKVPLRAGNGNALQRLLQQTLVRDDPALQGRHIYQKDKDIPEWREQSDLLATELYGDMIPVWGGIAAFETEPGSYLIVDEATYAETPSLLDETVFAAGEGYYILYHQE